MRVTDDEIMVALCCGSDHCRTESGHCHAADYFNEAQRVRRLLQSKMPTLIVLTSEEQSNDHPQS